MIDEILLRQHITDPSVLEPLLDDLLREWSHFPLIKLHQHPDAWKSVHRDTSLKYFVKKIGLLAIEPERPNICVSLTKHISEPLYIYFDMQLHGSTHDCECRICAVSVGDLY